MAPPPQPRARPTGLGLDGALERLERAEQTLFRRYGLDVKRSVLRLGGGRDARVLECGSGEPLVFIHGLGVLGSHWAPMMARLTNRRCIAVDLPGIGMSDPIEHVGSDLRTRMVSWLASVLGEIGANPASLIGSSFGGMCALWAARSRPDLVARVVCLGAPGVALPGGRSLLRAAAAGLPLPAAAGAWLRPPHPALTRLVLRIVIGRAAAARLPAEAVMITHEALQMPHVRRETWRVIKLLARPGRPHPDAVVMPRDDLAAIDAPCLFVWGGKDVYLRPRKAERLVELIPRAELVVLDAGHAPWLDDAPRCAELVASFGGDGEAPGRPARRRPLPAT